MLSEKILSARIKEIKIKYICICTLRAPSPNNSRKVQAIRVFLPAPEGPYTSKCGKSSEEAYNLILINNIFFYVFTQFLV